ncbi:MAG: hypothetical protein R3E87_19790 [Burkholderiaceae bacterium]
MRCKRLAVFTIGSALAVFVGACGGGGGASNEVGSDSTSSPSSPTPESASVSTNEIRDDFNRADLQSVGNGWQDACLCPNGEKLALSLSNGAAVNATTRPGQVGTASGIYRPFDFARQTTVTALIFSGDGDPSAPDGGRFTHYFAFNNDGSVQIPDDSFLQSGYGLAVIRSGNTGENSRITVFDNGTLLAQVAFPPFLVDSVAKINATFQEDGQVIGTLLNPLTQQSFSFSLTGRPIDRIASGGSNFIYVNGRNPQAGSPRLQAIDDLEISQGRAVSQSQPSSNGNPLLERDSFQGNISGLLIAGELYQNLDGRCEFHHRIVNTNASRVRAFLVFEFDGPNGYVGSVGGLSRTLSQGQTLALDDITTRIARRGAGASPIRCSEITQIKIDPNSLVF